MKSRSHFRSVLNGFAAFSALAFLGPVGVLAQAPAGGDATKSGGTETFDKLKDVKITLTSDAQNLVEALRALLKGAGADFVIDDELKSGTATVHFKDLPFKDALATFIKVATIPIKYEVKDGVFHFSRRIDPPVEEKTPEPPPSARKRVTSGTVPLTEITAANALRKLTGQFDSQAPTQYQYSNQPVSHGGTSSFALGSNGLFQSNGVRYNPDGSVSRSGTPAVNLINILRGLLRR